jgi:hypothetical protein
VFGPNLLSSVHVLSTLSGLAVSAAAALAYIGPGAGLELVGYAFSLIAMAGVALSAVLLWPVYTLLRWFRGTKHTPPPATPAEADAPPARSDAPIAAQPVAEVAATP